MRAYIDQKTKNRKNEVYRAELIKRMQNSTCLDEYKGTLMSNNQPFDPELWSTYTLEEKLKLCVGGGK